MTYEKMKMRKLIKGEWCQYVPFIGWVSEKTADELGTRCKCGKILHPFNPKKMCAMCYTKKKIKKVI